MTSEEEQEAVHEALARVLAETELLPEGSLLTGWCLSFERRSADEQPVAGALYGPPSLATWNAIGLLEWGRICLDDNRGENLDTED